MSRWHAPIANNGFVNITLVAAEQRIRQGHWRYPRLFPSSVCLVRSRSLLPLSPSAFLSSISLYQGRIVVLSASPGGRLAAGGGRDPLGDGESDLGSRRPPPVPPRLNAAVDRGSREIRPVRSTSRSAVARERERQKADKRIYVI